MFHLLPIKLTGNRNDKSDRIVTVMVTVMVTNEGKIAVFTGEGGGGGGGGDCTFPVFFDNFSLI